MPDRALLHIDGDSFFASCEVSLDLKLKGKPVVIGMERGMVIALTYRAKSLGVERGMTMWYVKKNWPNIVILPSDHITYSIFSQRMYSIVRRYTEKIEEYSIDECFADITGLDIIYGLSYEEIAQKIKKELYRDLGLTFSIGLASNKVLAKLGSKYRKPDGFTVVDKKNVWEFLENLPIENVWGIGGSSANKLNSFGIIMASDFARKELKWVEENFAKPLQEIYLELNGYFINKLNTEKRVASGSLSRTRSFTAPTDNKIFLLSELSINIENICIKARKQNLVAKKVFFFIKNIEFQSKGIEIELPVPTSSPISIIEVIRNSFDKIYEKNYYRSTGVILSKLSPNDAEQGLLFRQPEKNNSFKNIYSKIDNISSKYGEGSIFLGSSLSARNISHSMEGNKSLKYPKFVRSNITSRKKRLSIPCMGEAH